MGRRFRELKRRAIQAAWTFRASTWPSRSAISPKRAPSTASLLGCPRGDPADEWVDFDFHGHQIVAHLSPDETGHKSTNAVDGHDVPVRHFGLLILELPAWEALAERLKAAGTSFVIEPHIRFPGQPGEQATMFFLDPSGNALEFKARQRRHGVCRK